MCAKNDNNFEIRLKNAEGVPILQLGGTVTKTALAAVRSALERLANAGHFNVILNIERAHAANWRFLAELGGAVTSIRKHYGAVNLVAAQDRIQHLLGIDRVARLFRFCRSDGEAISQIKGLHREPDGVRDTNARFLEK